MKKIFMFCLFFISGMLYAQIPLSQTLKEIPELTGGIKKIEIQGTPGRVILIGANSFYILADLKSIGLAAGSFYGKGKAAVFTHLDFLNPKKWIKNETEKLFSQTLQWLLPQKTGKKIKIVGNTELSDYLRKIGYQVDQSKDRFKDLSGFGLLIFLTDVNESYSADEMQNIRRFVLEGGSILSAPMAWVWKNYSKDGKEGKSLSEYAANQIYGPMGLLFMDWYSDNKITVDWKRFKESHPLVKLNRILHLINQPAVLKLEELNSLISWTFDFLTSLDYPNGLLSQKQIEAIFKLYQSVFKIPAPTEKNPVLPFQVREVLLISILNAINSGVLAGNQINTVCADIFPGKSSEKSLIINDFKLDLGFPKKNSRWQSTGLYAPAGSKIIIELMDKNWLSQRLFVRIGIHKDLLIPFSDKIKEWRRFPNLVTRKELFSLKTELSSPVGGLIFIELPDFIEIHESLRLKISGVIQAPFFQLGKTKALEWRQSIRNLEAPWGELEGQNIVLTMPSDVLKKIEDPEKLILWWDAIIKYYTDLSGKEQHAYKERMVPDIQISSGYMHSGYPVMTHMDAAEFSAGLRKSLVEKESLFEQGSWGHFHELGHNYQKTIYTFEGSGEVTVNLFTLYVLQKHLNIGLKEHPWFKGKDARLKKYRESGLKFEDWKKDPQIGLLTFIGIIEKFGWDAIKKSIRRFDILEQEKKNLSDLEKRNCWVIFLSEEAGYNLAPYFKKWGVLFDEKAVSKVYQLKVWKDFPVP